MAAPICWSVSRLTNILAMAAATIRAVDVTVRAGPVSVGGFLRVPTDATGMVLFAHGSGSSRHSPRNQRVAERLNDAKLGTLLIDLLTPEEEETDVVTGEHRFDIPLLAERLAGAVRWLGEAKETAHLPVGLFGASTGAAAALVAAAELPERVVAVVSRGGRPDLAGDALPRVQAPTLLVVGGFDAQVIELNREAMARMSAPVELRIVEGASHLFEEPGKLDRVAELAAEWFRRHLV